MSVTRRGFLARSGLVAAAGWGSASVVRSAEAGPRRGQRPKRILHLVADGMSMGTLTCADYFSVLRRRRGLSWTALASRPGVVNAWMNMRSLNSTVTDSSAASSSWGSGSRIVNGAVNVLPDGRALTSLYQLMGEAGWKRGLVTTTEITHATPAGFVASGLTRDAGQDIAAQYLDRRIEVLLGGGRKFFESAKRKDKRDLRGEFRAAGYTVMEKAEELARAPGEGRWLGTFADGHLPYTVDQMGDEGLRRDVPTLAAMTAAALRRLEREERFVLQVEGGRVDHGAHGCDAVAALGDMIAFDEALDECLGFQRRHPDTLLVVTTDHGNGNPGVSGAGSGYKDSVLLFSNLARGRRSFEGMSGMLSKAKTTAEMGEVIFEATGYRAPEAKLELLAPYIARKGKALYDLTNSPEYQLGQLLGNYYGVGWVSGSHTSDFVPLTAVGPGAERLAGFIANTEVFRHYLGLARIDFRNPELPLMAGGGPSAMEVEGPTGAWV